MDPQASVFMPVVAVRPESSVGGDSDRTVTQESYDRSLQTAARATSPHSPAAAALGLKFTFVKLNSASTTTTATTMSDNSKTPRNKRLSNGPGASSADKYPEDSPTRVRHPPRFPAAMQNQRHRRAQPQQQAEFCVDDTEAWPSLGEANTQTRHQQRIAARVGRSSSVSTSDSNTQQPAVAQQPNAVGLSPEQRDVFEAQVKVYHQSLVQQHTPTSRMSISDRNPSQPRLAPYSAYQQSAAQQGSSQQYTHQNDEQQARKSRPELSSTRPPFASESIAGLVAAQQQQQLTTQQQQQQQQASPFRVFLPGQNSAYNLDRLVASQEAQRHATVAQLHSAFNEPQTQRTATVAQLHSAFIESTYAQSNLTKNRGHRSYGFQPRAYANYSSFHGYNAPTEVPAAVPHFSQPTAGSLNPSAQGFNPQPEASASANPPRGQTNRAYLPVFDIEAGRNIQTDASIAAPAPRGQAHLAFPPAFNAAAGRNNQTDASIAAPAPRGQAHLAFPPTFNAAAEVRSTQSDTRAPAIEASTTEPAFSAADYDVSPPPSPSQALADLMNPRENGCLRPDNRPLSLSQQTGARYGIEIGGLGSSMLGTSDRTNWLPSPWNQPGQERASRARPLGWEWTEQRGLGKRDDKT